LFKYVLPTRQIHTLSVTRGFTGGVRIRSAGFPTRKSLEDFNFDHQPALHRDMIAHLGTGAFLTKARNVVLLGPPEAG
jgi:DNA replication protein DnaC